MAGGCGLVGRREVMSSDGDARGLLIYRGRLLFIHFDLFTGLGLRF